MKEELKLKREILGNTNIISISNLQFGYQRNQLILKDLSMIVPEGSIYGFLGANGAGKSTTIRNVLGLLKPNSGQITIFEKNLAKAERSLFSNIGSLIESPSLYPNLDAIDNLEIACKYQHADTKAIPSILDKVGLSHAAKKATSKYSTGMKQRLGLAMALIHDPELLILDEPTNGLDPKGITEIREILIRLKEEGKTIMLSSHLLSEIEKIVSHVGIIKNGALVFEGTLNELDELKSAKPSIQIKANDLEKVKVILTKYSIQESTKEYVQIQLNHKNDIPTIIRNLVNEGIDLYEVNILKNDLEKIFIDITNE